MINNHDHQTKVNLIQSIKEYRKNREDLVNIQEKTQEAFVQITNILKPSTSELLECVNIERISNAVRGLGLISHEENKQEKYEMLFPHEKMEIENPAIAILGQVKAGKSTFVNALLRKDVTCQGYEKCTARLCRLMYSEINFVELVDVDGKITDRKLLRKSKIPDNYVKLDEENRNNSLEVRKEVRAGINCLFLKNGIDIIDTPGLNESSLLSNLSKDMVRNLLPVIIYVIDGRTSFKQSDLADILELKNAVPNLQIIYFITKLDIEDNLEAKDRDPFEIAKMKMDLAFKKLQYNNLIPSTFSHWSECSYFHGASLYAYCDYLKKKETPETLFHKELFSRFESCLGFYLLCNFENKIMEVSNTIINFHLDVLTKIIDRIKSLTDFYEENVNNIFKIKMQEEELFEKIKSIIFNSKFDLMNRLVKKLNNESSSILSPVVHLNYPSSFEISDDGRVLDSTIVEQCRKFIIDFICLGLDNVIKQFIADELYKIYNTDLENPLIGSIKNKKKSQDGNSNGTSPYLLCLRRILTENYDFDVSSGTSKMEAQNITLKLLNIIIYSIKNFFWKIFNIKTVKKYVEVKSPEWKLRQSNRCLSNCDYNLLAEEIINKVVEDLEMKHMNFVKDMEQEQKFLEKKVLISNTIREDIISKAPEFTYLLMLTLDVKSRYLLMDANDEEFIGQGTQYVVYRSICQGKTLAKKTRILHVTELKTIAEEVYYSYLFQHPRLLPFIAISIKDVNVENNKLVSIYSPLMKTDVLNYLLNNKTSMVHRLTIGLQVAEALKYLHSHQIMHRDLKLANILLDKENNVFLADYGWCKLTCFSKQSVAGTPIHMAPEIIRKISYDYKIDIYSFGILLWYLAEGQGNHPRYARVNSDCYRVLWAAAEYNQRPERLDTMSDDFWNLICTCWDKNPENRPDTNEVIKSLKDIIKNLSKHEI